ncbi:hypothetical protein AMATHDRAFT_66915 [Amanita thiersii Skay4041]|uniref:Glutamine synthetase n=1 Tax=Amanita thiersii Skay4041 TaxID=703135 RepID=A0A2A9NEN1_9AGAR|nr:hypothetical protein AMATHDRAFT_66915 [Amanita thiersii Skay4041]
MDKFNHGVLYTPSSVSASSLTLQQAKSQGIKYIRLQWVDLVNTVRFRVIPVSYFEKLLQSSRAGVGVAKVCLGLVYLITAPGFSPMGEYLYVPDMSTLRLCPYAPGHASVMGRFEEKTPIEGPGGEFSFEVDLCPRTLLKRVVDDAKTTSGLDFLVGFETEFILLKSTNPVEASNIHSWTASDGFPSGHVETEVLQTIVDDLQTSGIEVQMYHPEAAPGQYEIATGPLPPLEAADALVHVRETVRNIAASRGLRATFAPRVFMTSAGSSAHTNISVHSSNEGAKPINGLSPVESSFLAGVLHHLESLPALTLPIPASYKRMADGVWSGGTYVGWGYENREAPIRLTNATSPISRRFEMRYVDATANPHIVLAGILTAGHDGVRSKRALTIQNCPGPESAAQMGEERRAALGITRRLPLTWEEARSNMEKSDLLRKEFGDNFVTKYLAVNKILGDALNQDHDEKAALTRLVEFY